MSFIAPIKNSRPVLAKHQEAPDSIMSPLSRRCAGGRLAAALVILALPLVLSGCATLSEGECRTADWFQVGRQDGANGYKRARLFDHRKACVEYGVRPEPEAYYTGRQIGLARYCSADNGFREGRAGRPYRGVCPTKYENRFLIGYRKGKIIHEVDEEVESIEDDIRMKETLLGDDDTGAEQADNLRDDLRNLYRELRYRSRELIRLERRHGTGGYLPRP